MRKAYVVFLIIALCTNLKLKAQGDKDTTLESALELSIEELMDTKVSIATKSEKKLTETPAIVSVFTAKQIQNMGARDLRDVLRTIPGFQLGMRDLGYTTIGVRGVTTQNSEKVKIMIDGIPVNEHLEGSGTVVFADIVLDNIERIEVIRGPGSALYGTNAFLGVINIISKNVVDKNEIKASVKAGSFKTYESNVSIRQLIGNTNLNVFFDYISTEGPKRKIEFDVLSNDPDNSGISLAGTEHGYTNMFKEKLTASVNVQNKGLYSKSLFVVTKKGDYVGPASAINKESEAKHFQLQQMFGYQHTFNKNTDIDINGFYLLYNAGNLWNTFPNGYTQTLPDGSQNIYTQGMHEKMGGKQQTIGAKLQFNYHLHKSNTLQVGVSYMNIKYFDAIYKRNLPGSDKEGLINIPPFFDDKTLYRNVSSIYVQDLWQMNDKLSFTVGSRVDLYSDAGLTFNPRGALVYSPLEWINLKLLYGTAFRAPTFAEIYLNAAPMISGDRNIKPETIHTSEVYVGVRANKNLSISINYFNNNIKNLISILPDSDMIIGKYGNSEDEINIQGFESEVKVIMSDRKKYAYITYTYQKGKNKNNNEKVIGMANHSFFVGINTDILKKMNLNIYTNYIGERARAKIDNRAALKECYLLNASLSVVDVIKNLDLQLSCYNLIDEDYRVPDISKLILNDYPLEGRNFIAEIRYKF